MDAVLCFVLFYFIPRIPGCKTRKKIRKIKKSSLDNVSIFESAAGNKGFGSVKYQRKCEAQSARKEKKEYGSFLYPP